MGSVQFDPEQDMLQTSARGLFDRYLSATVLHDMRSDERGFPPALYEAMAHLDWFGLLVPPSLGGVGARFADMQVLLVEAGRACLPGPFFPTAVTSALTLVFADGATSREILPSICSGEAFSTLALVEESASLSPSDISTLARRAGSDFLLEGVKRFVAEGTAADHFLVAARTPNDSADPATGITIFHVPAGSPGLRFEPLDSVGTERTCNVTFDRVRVPSRAVVGFVDEGWPILREVLCSGAVARSAFMLGGAERAMEIALEYARIREQFGQPISNFQSVQNHCVAMLEDVEAIRCVTTLAGAALDEGSKDRYRLGSVAKAWTNRAVTRVTQHAHRVMGAIGFTEACDLQFYTKAVEASRAEFGTSSFHAEIVASYMDSKGDRALPAEPLRLGAPEHS